MAKPLRAKSFSTADRVKKLRELLKAIKQAEKDGEKETASNLWKVAAVERACFNAG